jgi:hypothetical protein
LAPHRANILPGGKDFGATNAGGDRNSAKSLENVSS